MSAEKNNITDYFRALDELKSSDPEFARFFIHFAFDEVVNHAPLEPKTRMIVILATLLGCQGLELYRDMLPVALENDVTPVEAKEIIYQAVAYLGMGRVLPFLRVTNEIMQERGIALPLPPQATTTLEDRGEKGLQAQVDIFGNRMRETLNNEPAETRHIREWLAGNCFGDYYTRNGLNYAQRELITFFFLAAQGGCEAQLLSHATGNMLVGNDKLFLIRAVSQCIPYIGYPRALNALRCVNEAAEKLNKIKE